MIRKLAYILPLSLLCAGGIYINGAYYFQSYNNSGYSQFFSLGLSVLFMLLEFTLWFYGSNKIHLNILKFSIVIYSVTITMGAQYFSTSQLESEITESVYIEIDISGDVEYYRNQIKIQDDRINQIYRQRENDFMFSKTEESLKTAQNEKKNYEVLLESLKEEKTEKVQEINSPKNIYFWYAYSLPKIFSGELSDNFIRVIFQMFSSFLLAIIAPISLTMIRGYNPPENKITPVVTIVEPTVITPEPLSTDAKRDIIKMMYWYKEDGKGDVMTPEMASEEFKKIHEEKPSVRNYSVRECQTVWDEIMSRGLQNSSVENIREELGV